MSAGDAETLSNVMTDLYAKTKNYSTPVDLDDLFRQLGISERTGTIQRAGTIQFDGQAPLAAIRRSITAAPRNAASP